MSLVNQHQLVNSRLVIQSMFSLSGSWLPWQNAVSLRKCVDYFRYISTSMYPSWPWRHKPITRGCHSGGNPVSHAWRPSCTSELCLHPAHCSLAGAGLCWATSARAARSRFALVFPRNGVSKCRNLSSYHQDDMFIGPMLRSPDESVVTTLEA